MVHDTQHSSEKPKNIADEGFSRKEHSDMNELLKIDYTNVDKPTVLGRDLHKALEVQTAYKDWFPRMCEYGFEEGKDFNSLKNERVQIEGNRMVAREVVDHQITIAMAKELCMLQRSEKGKQFRQYFIQVEEAWNTPEQVMARALQMANRMVDKLKKDNAYLLEKAEADAPKVLFANAVETSDSTILVGQLAKLIRQNGIEIGQNRLFKWLRANGYLMKHQNIPTQYSMELGLMEIKERTVNNPDGSVRITQTPMITGKGQTYFVSLFLKGA